MGGRLFSSKTPILEINASRPHLLKRFVICCNTPGDMMYHSCANVPFPEALCISHINSGASSSIAGLITERILFFRDRSEAELWHRIGHGATFS
jgi:hypothetical protein